MFWKRKIENRIEQLENEMICKDKGHQWEIKVSLKKTICFILPDISKFIFEPNTRETAIKYIYCERQCLRCGKTETEKFEIKGMLRKQLIDFENGK